MTRTVKAAIRKNQNGSYELTTNIGMAILSVMTQEQFEKLMRELEAMRNAEAKDAPVCYFPEFTHRITG